MYHFWRQLENLPAFMKHLKSVVVTDEKSSTWEAQIPGKLGTIGWTSEIIADVPNEFLAWKSLPGAQIENTGTISFVDAGKFGTEVHIEIAYHAPGGTLGSGAAKLLNPLFEAMVKEDIKNFRRYIETREIPTIENQPSGKN